MEKHQPINNRHLVKVVQTTADLCSIKLHPVAFQARRTNVMDMELQVPSIHYGQNHTQRVLGLIGISQTHLHRERHGGCVVYVNDLTWNKGQIMYKKERQKDRVLHTAIWFSLRVLQKV